MVQIIQRFSKHYDERQDKVRALVLHCSAHSPQKMIEVLDEKELSAHYIIGEDGEIWQTVSEKKRAWHAGVSKWRNMKNLNHCSVGIELSSPTMGQKSYSPAQLKAAQKLCRSIIRHYQIPLTNVVGHSDIAPTRKADPGKSFPWKDFAAKGIGLWYNINDADKVAENDVEKLLNIIGYDTENLSAAAYAFCRHFVSFEIAEKEDITDLERNVCPPDFEFPQVYIPILKACAYRYMK